MRNRKKWKFIRKNRENNISKFDRQTINRYPGKRLPMRRRSLNPIRNTWFYKYNVWIPSKYIEGLLTKYIGKPYSEFKRKYDERTQSIRDKGVNTDKELSTYFNPRYNPDFYVDNDGFIQVARKTLSGVTIRNIMNIIEILLFLKKQLMIMEQVKLYF